MVRHGSTVDNEKGVLRGWADQPLDPNGEREAQLAARKLTIYRPKMIYSSDLTRDMQTAQIIGEYFHVPHEVDFNLRTADMGEWTEQSEEKLLEAQLDWYQNPWKEAPGGDSVNGWLSRFFPAFDSKMEQAKLDAYRPTVMVSHGRNIAAVNWRYSGGNQWEAAMTLPGGIMVIRENGFDFPPFTIEFLGETEPIIEDE